MRSAEPAGSATGVAATGRAASREHVNRCEAAGRVLRLAGGAARRYSLRVGGHRHPDHEAFTTVLADVVVSWHDVSGPLRKVRLVDNLNMEIYLCFSWSSRGCKGPVSRGGKDLTDLASWCISE
jgi:hypothetical protein